MDLMGIWGKPCDRTKGARQEKIERVHSAKMYDDISSYVMIYVYIAYIPYVYI